MIEYTNYATEINEETIDQFESALNESYVVKAALMADAHLGYSIPIGSVIATKDVVVPSWVGYDIGCGVLAIRLENVKPDLIKSKAKLIYKEIYDVIPVGFEINETEFDLSCDGLSDIGKLIADKKQYKKAFGSLGGGNHFIEVGEDEVGDAWIVVHSGSRGVGHAIAKHYMTVASNNPEMYGKEFDDNNKHLLKHNPDKYNSYRDRFISKKIMKDKAKEGHYGLDVNSKLGNDYLTDHQWCIDYAGFNRMYMASKVSDIISNLFNVKTWPDTIDGSVNKHHNFVETDSDGMYVHRKGAAIATVGSYCPIPANMRDGTYIVKGKGNPNSLMSSSHGAGRAMSRNKATSTLDMNNFKNQMENITATVTEATLSESPDAYKKFKDVMENQKDLVEVVYKIKPIINIKGN